MNKIKLTDLKRYELLNDELNNLKGGDRPLCFGCNCTCTCTNPTPASRTTDCTYECKRSTGIISVIVSPIGY